MRACKAALSASLKTATVEMPSLRAVVMTRQAISPRFATNSFLIGTGPCDETSPADASASAPLPYNDLVPLRYAFIQQSTGVWLLILSSLTEAQV